MAVQFRFRKPIRLGPTWACLRWNFTQRGYSGWSLHVWRWTYSNRTERHSFDTPGLGGITWGGRKRGRS